MLAETHVKVSDLLRSHRQALQDLAKFLVEKEVAERPQLQTILKAKESRKSRMMK
jgi:ATP-dependent Zn protease